MDHRKLQFLQAVIGNDGARALAKATSQSAELEWALFPRVVMSWLEVHSQYNEPLPGVEDTKLNFKKSENGFRGTINIGDDLYTFNDVSLYHVAGSVAVALGSEARQAPDFRNPQLAKLGKSIDLLVKSRTLRKMQAKAKGGAAKGVKLPGAAAAPMAPQGPVPPDPTQEKPSDKQLQNGAAGSNVNKVPSSNKPKKSTLKVTKSESSTRCSTCGAVQFKKESYSGCICFADLAKSVKTTSTEEGYILEFGAAWDAEAIATLAENLGK